MVATGTVQIRHGAGITLPGLEAWADRIRPRRHDPAGRPRTELQRRGLTLIAGALAAEIPIVVVESETRWWPPPDARGRLDVNRQTLEALIRRNLVHRHAATGIVDGLTVPGMHYLARYA